MHRLRYDRTFPSGQQIRGKLLKYRQYDVNGYQNILNRLLFAQLRTKSEFWHNIYQIKNMNREFIWENFVSSGISFIQSNLWINGVLESLYTFT